MKHYKMIGLCGLARTGKDTLCQALINECATRGIRAKRYSIADELKKQLYPFIWQQYEIDIYNCTNEEKELVRPLMVDWGLIHRQRSEGAYLTDILQGSIDADTYIQNMPMMPMMPMSACNITMPSCDLPIITDVRYDQYKKDEVYWVKERNQGALVHIKKIIGEDNNGNPIYVEPPNEQERLNDPILQDEADYHVEWPRMEGSSDAIEVYSNAAKEVLDALHIGVSDDRIVNSMGISLTLEMSVCN